MDVYMDDTIADLIAVAGIDPESVSEVRLTPLELVVQYLAEPASRTRGTRTIPVRVHLDPRPDPGAATTKEK